MRIAIYTPYLDSFGGGERYILTIAECLSSEDQVDLLLDRHHLALNPRQLKEELGKRLNLDLSKVNLVAAPIGPGGGFLKRLAFLKNYDVFFYLTDGSILLSTAKRSFIHFQVPFSGIQASNPWMRLKQSTWKEAVFNSRFTREVVEKQWDIKGRVIYPPVDIARIKPMAKKPFILSVGRFASFTKSKKHEEMIKTFVSLYETGQVKEWSLHLAGSLEGDPKYIDELKALAKEAPVHIYPNLPFKELMDLYGESSIYWHATGFGETDPAKMEHFGISTVEAMAAGCVPVVINLGGQKEIVEDGKTGFLWDNLDELQQFTLKLINDSKFMTNLSNSAQQQVDKYSKERFSREIKELVHG